VKVINEVIAQVFGQTIEKVEKPESKEETKKS
jgi:hypothetical protein